MTKKNILVDNLLFNKIINLIYPITKIYILVLFGMISATAQVRISNYFGNNMILQRNEPIVIWGWAIPDEKISISFAGKNFKTTTSKDSTWQIQMPSMAADNRTYDIHVKGQNYIKLTNIVLGDVWLCGGQSNMEFTFDRLNYYQEISTKYACENIRLINIQRNNHPKPQNNISTNGWKSSDPQNNQNFSVVAFFFAKKLYEKYKVPIGLISSNWGGTPIEVWMSSNSISKYPGIKNAYKKSTIVADWQPSSLYNGMINPIIKIKLKGVIWYQGESNVGRAHQYQSLFPALIKDWRLKFDFPEMPFLFVQLANFMAPITVFNYQNWPELREAQSSALALPKTGMAVSIDIGDALDIHPKNKKDVGFRLAKLAQKIVYNESIVASGPKYKSMKIENNTIILNFKDIGLGLKAKNGLLREFVIAGENQKFVFAKAKIKGNSIIVTNKNISKPVAVRYAWADNPSKANLYNKDGFPASPFRTDNWKMKTFGVIKID